MSCFAGSLHLHPDGGQANCSNDGTGSAVSCRIAAMGVAGMMAPNLLRDFVQQLLHLGMPDFGRCKWSTERFLFSTIARMVWGNKGKVPVACDGKEPALCANRFDAEAGSSRIVPCREQRNAYSKRRCMARQMSAMLLRVLTGIVSHWMHFSRGAVLSRPAMCGQSMVPLPGVLCSSYCPWLS